MAFLTTRVNCPDEDDWGKMKRVVKYLNVTKNLELTLMADNLWIIRWFVDALYATHNDCTSHTGSVMTWDQEWLIVS